MQIFRIFALTLGLLSAGGALADPPPSVAPGYRVGGSLIPVAIYDASGNIITSFGGGGGGGAGGSVTAAGVNGTSAQAVQGITGGVPQTVTGSFLIESTFTGRINTLGQKTSAQSTPVVLPSDQTVPVSGTFWQATQPVSGPLTDTQLRATAVPISASSLPLMTGAATSALQTSGNSSLTSIDTKLPALVTGRTPVDGSAVTQPISAAALPLPTGAASATNQTTANTSLSSIDTKTPALVSGRQPVDGSAVTQPISATALPLPTGAASSALQGTTNTSLASIDAKSPALASGRVPVDGSGVTQPISGSVTTLPGSATGSTSAFTAGTTSAQAIAAATRKFLAIDNESTTATISVSFGGTAAINSAGSFTIPPGATRVWDGTFVPSEAVNIISGAASTPVTLQVN